MLTPRQAAALDVLLETNGKGGNSAVAAVIRVSVQRAAQLVKHLEREGYVHRARYGRRIIVQRCPGDLVLPQRAASPVVAWRQLDDDEREQIGVAALELLIAGRLPTGAQREQIVDAVAVGAPFLNDRRFRCLKNAVSTKS